MQYTPHPEERQAQLQNWDSASSRKLELQQRRSFSQLGFRTLIREMSCLVAIVAFDVDVLIGVLEQHNHALISLRKRQLGKFGDQGAYLARNIQRSLLRNFRRAAYKFLEWTGIFLNLTPPPGPFEAPKIAAKTRLKRRSSALRRKPA